MAATSSGGLTEQVLSSRPWRWATARAQDYLDGSRDLGALLRRASARIESAPLVGEALDDARTLVRLLRAYSSGRYRDVAVEDLLLSVGGLVYLVSPLDLIPDLIAGVGLADDLAVLGFVVRSIPDVLGRFRAWEAREGVVEPVDAATAVPDVAD